MSEYMLTDNDSFCCQWLRNLVDDGHLSGRVVEKCVTELRASDCEPVSHFFAGIGGWPLALHWAGWPEDRPVWTASLPCQPFSSVGNRKGNKDERHLWPVFRKLVEQREPPVIFGEQVASKAGREWLAGVRDDLEALGYAVGAADMCAAGAGAPHIRQRLFWVANGVGLGDAVEQGLEGLTGNEHNRQEPGRLAPASRRPVAPTGWDGCAVVRCVEPSRDGGSIEKRRRCSPEPGAFPLADGVPNRVGRLRGYGNAIVPQLAAEFVACAEEAINDERS